MNPKDTVYAIAALGLAIWLVFEHRALREQRQELFALQQQLSQMTDVVADANGRMSNLVVQAHQLQAQRVDQVREVLQLREEVKVLRQQTGDIQALRGEVDQVRTAVQGNVNPQSQGRTVSDSRVTPQSSRLQILAAYYWTPNKAIDVTKQLADKIEGDKLEVIAGNNLRGDPEFGQPKMLTVLYSYDGVTRTNQVTEGGLLLLPEE